MVWGRNVEVTIDVDDQGRLRSIHLDRWNSAGKPPGLQPFGGDVASEFVTPDGVRIAGSGTIGWNHQTPEWPKGKFFRFDLQSAEPVPAA